MLQTETGPAGGAQSSCRQKMSKNNGISEERQPTNRQQPVRLKEPGRTEEFLLAASSPRALKRLLIGGKRGALAFT